jgi:hypothetical protein
VFACIFGNEIWDKSLLFTVQEVREWCQQLGNHVQPLIFSWGEGKGCQEHQV